MTRRAAYLILFVFGCFLLVPIGMVFPLQILAELAGGWALFLGRVIPGVRVDWGGVAIGGGCLALLAILAHSFFGWLYPLVRRPDDGSKWKAKWTASLVAGIVLMFAAGISAAGIAHQVGWLVTSKEPLIENSFRRLDGRVQSSNNLKQMGLAILNYESAEGSLPPGATLDAEGRLLHGWQARVLPFLDTSPLYNNINFNLSWDAAENSTAIRTRVNVYLNPGIRRSDPEPPGPAPSHYAGNPWLLGGDSLRKLKEITDGTSNTLLAGEVADQFKPWGYPANWRDPAKGVNRARDGFGGPYPGGANFLMADGSVRFIKDTIASRVFRSLATPDGGEALSNDQY